MTEYTIQIDETLQTIEIQDGPKVDVSETIVNIINVAEPGPAGADGAPGAGVPAGGTTGQIMAKASDTDYDTAWVDPPSGGLTGTTTQVVYFDGSGNPTSDAGFTRDTLNGVVRSETSTADLVNGFTFNAIGASSNDTLRGYRAYFDDTTSVNYGYGFEAQFDQNLSASGGVVAFKVTADHDSGYAVPAYALYSGNAYLGMAVNGPWEQTWTSNDVTDSTVTFVNNVDQRITINDILSAYTKVGSRDALTVEGYGTASAGFFPGIPNAITNLTSIETSAFFSGILYAMSAQQIVATHNGSGSVGGMFGQAISMQNAGAGAVDIGYQLYLQPYSGAFGTKYGLYQQGDDAQNVMQGSLNVGNGLAVTGNTDVQSLVVGGDFNAAANAKQSGPINAVAEKRFRSQGLSATGSPVKYTPYSGGTNDLTLNVFLYESEVDTDYLVTISKTQIFEITALNQDTGTPIAVNDIVTGVSSSATGTVIYVNGNTVYVENNTGLQPTEAITYGPTGVEISGAYLDGISDPFDMFDWNDGSNYVTGVRITGSTQTLSLGTIITFGSINGHGFGDTWSFTAKGVLTDYLVTDYRFGIAGLGDVFGNESGVAHLVVPRTGRSYTIGYSPVGTAIDVSGVTGLDDLTYDKSGFRGEDSLPYVYTLTIASNSPDTVNWNDDRGNSGSFQITGGEEVTLSKGMKVTFANSTGHTIGDVWTFTATRYSAYSQYSDHIIRFHRIGYAAGEFNGTNIEVDDESGAVTVNAPQQFNANASGSSTWNMGSSWTINGGGLYVNAPFHVANIYSSGGALRYNLDAGHIYDNNGSIRFNMSESNLVRIYNVGGTEVGNFGNNGFSFPNYRSGHYAVQIVNQFQRVTNRITANTTLYLASTQSSFLVDASAGNITIQIENASANNRYSRVDFKRIDNTANTVTITTVGGTQNIDGATSISLNTQYMVRELAAEFVSGSTYCYYITRAYL